MISITILAAALVVLMHFMTPWIVQKWNLGDAAALRFIERGATIPDSTELNAKNLTRWVKKHRLKARAYAFPVLFPLDTIFICSFAIFVAAGSWLLITIGGIPIAKYLPPSSVFVTPIAFALADLFEDTLAATLLCAPRYIGERTIAALKLLTAAKMATFVVALAQILVLAGWGTARFICQ